PVPIDGSQVLLSKGYSGGAELIELAAISHQPVASARDLSGTPPLAAESKWKNSRVLQTKFTNVVIHGGHAYGLSEGILECVEVATGKRKWKNGRFEQGQILGVGDLLLVLSENGELCLVELSPTK